MLEGGLELGAGVVGAGVVGAGVVGAGSALGAGAAVGTALNVSTPDGLFVVTPAGAGVRTLLLLPLVAVVPQPQTTKS